MYKVVNQKRKKWWVKEKVSRRWRNWCQNEVYEETKGADSRDKVKHNGRTWNDLEFFVPPLAHFNHDTNKWR